MNEVSALLDQTLQEEKKTDALLSKSAQSRKPESRVRDFRNLPVRVGGSAHLTLSTMKT